ncbi:MAG: hypothetical protein ACOC9N_03070, partial [Gemmatimonadota bacterium]
MPPEIRPLFHAIAIAALAAAPIAAQEVRASALRGSTDHTLMGSPDGFDVEAGWNLAPRLGIRAAY